MLVVGAAGGAQRDICERFLETDDEQLFVDTDNPVRDGDEEASEVIERPFPTRAAATADAAGPLADITSIAADLRTLMRDLGETDGTLRVCFDSIRPFVDAADLPSLVMALESVQDTAREVGAVVHFHLPAMPEAVPQNLFDAVDAVVEVRRQGGTTYQRWRFPGRTETTKWVEV